ncbi:MAG: hypothetical protein AAGU19_04555 [Prolixibacteraceae bacterium]
MNTENQKKIPALPPRFRRFFVAGVIILAVIALQYTFLSVSAVRKRMKAINSEIDVKLLTPADVGKDTAWLRLYKEKDWLETRFQIARTDSISLSVNLSDSTMQIELKGVVLKKTKILDFEVDRFLYRLTPGAYHHLLGKQARADTVIASIPRQPLIIKKAPKDTTEVEDGTATIDTTKLEIVHWVLNLDNQMVVKIEGVDPGVRSDWWAGHRFWMFQNLKQTAKDLSRTVLFKMPEYQPEIRLIIPEADAKALYRALPVKPLVCIRL